MSVLYDRLSSLCEEMKITPYRMAKDVGISQSLMTDLKMGRRDGVSAKTADKIAAYFGVTVGYLIGSENNYDSILYERIISLCSDNGITGYRLCKDVGISPNVMTELKTGRQDGLSAKTANKIADYFGVSVGYLLGTEDKKEEPTVAGGLGALIPGYDELSVEHKADAIRYIEFLLQKQKGEA